MHEVFGFNIFISENNIHGNYNIVIYINIIRLERKQYSLFGSSPKHEVFDFQVEMLEKHWSIV